MRIPYFLIETSNSDNIVDLFNRDKLINDLYELIKDNEKKWWLKIWLYWKWWVWKTTILKKLWKKFKDDMKSFRYSKSETKVIFLSTNNVSSFKEVFWGFLDDIKYWFWLLNWFLYFYFKVFISLFIIIFFLSFIITFFSNINDLQSFQEAIISNTIMWLIISTATVWVIKLILSVNFIKWYNQNIDTFFITIYLYLKKKLWSRVIIIVDDIDRLKPDFIPDILLWISNISSIEKWLVSTIISADPEKLAESIKKWNSQYKWDEWYKFLDRIIDTPYYLDDLNTNSKYVFWNKHKKELINDFKWFESIEWFIDYLPNNIRGIKRYFRFLYSNINQFKRFYDTEINFWALLFISLIKLENPKECYEFIENELPKIDNHVLSNSEENLEKLEWFNKKIYRYLSKVLIVLDEVVKYYYFYDNLPVITSKEFYNEFIKDKKNTDDLIKKFDNNFWQLILFLTYELTNYYSNMISCHVTEDMKNQEIIVNIIYEHLAYITSLIPKDYIISSFDFNKIIVELSRYRNFNSVLNEIDCSKHREAEDIIINHIVNKINPRVLLTQEREFKWFNIDKKIENIYWDYLLENINLFSFYDELPKLRYILYENLVNLNWIKQIKVINNIWNYNLYKIIYSLLEMYNIKKNDDNFIELLKGKNLWNIFKQIKLQDINQRFLWSFKQEILDEIDDNSLASINIIKTEIEKYILN